MSLAERLLTRTIIWVGCGGCLIPLYKNKGLGLHHASHLLGVHGAGGHGRVTHSLNIA
jgi:hypothetical protein